MHPFLLSSAVPLDAYSMRIMRNTQGTKEFTVETRTRMLHFHSREAPREPTSRVQGVLKSLQPSSSLFPRGQRSSRHLEQSPGVFMVSSSRSRLASSASLSLSRSTLYIPPIVVNVASVVVIHVQLTRLESRETCRHRSLY